AVHLNQALQKKARQEANSDALTGVNNRRWLEELLLRTRGRPLEDLAPLSVIMLDVDHFKRFNDDYGHQTGDEVLKMVAQAMQSSLRPNDMVARYGGEEFVILLPKTRLKHSLQVAERLRRKVERTPINAEDKAIPGVTISLGVAQWQPGISLEALIGQADEALYRAKESGRNRVSQ
ncbi:MAG: GGDEF domain-containing protein, partial [Ketobacteraceae bacterium]|nr:GGDEF domain-containing protein [Ketobacteraceae bacterium]